MAPRPEAGDEVAVRRERLAGDALPGLALPDLRDLADRDPPGEGWGTLVSGGGLSLERQRSGEVEDAERVAAPGAVVAHHAAVAGGGGLPLLPDPDRPTPAPGDVAPPRRGRGRSPEDPPRRGMRSPARRPRPRRSPARRRPRASACGGSWSARRRSGSGAGPPGWTGRSPGRRAGSPAPRP